MAEAPQHPAVVQSAAARRLRGFKLHLMGYALVVVALLAIHVVVQPERPWFVLILVGWGAPLALHCAYVMGLFGGRR